MFSEPRNMTVKGQLPKYVDIGALRSLSPAGQTNSQVDASQRKFAKPELAYGLAKGGQTDSQVNASLQNQNLRTDLRRAAKRIRKSARKSQKSVYFTHIIG